MSAIEFVEGDITKVEADVIVNAANSELAGGGGVDGAIHRAAGPSVMEECRSIGGCAVGTAVATKAGDLSAKWIFHAVGPIFSGKEKDVFKLASCHIKCLDMAVEKECRTIAFPAISTGAFGYPVAQASVISVGTVQGWIQKNPGKLDRVTFVLFDKPTHDAYAGSQKKRV